MIGNVTAANLAGMSTPAPFAGYSLWLDASDASTFTYSSGSLVSSWADKSSNHYNFTQSTSGYQPTRNTNVQNGLPAVSFSAKALVNTSFSWGSSNTTTFFVMRQTNTTGYQNVFTAGTGATGDYSYGIYDPSANSYFGLFRIGQAATSYGVAPSTGNADVICFKGGGVNTSTYLYKNGTGAGANPQSFSASGGAGAVLGSNAAFNEDFKGYFCEIISYPSQLSDANRNAVEAYLKTKWGTP